MKVKNPIVIQKYGGPWKLVLDLDGDSIEAAKAMQSDTETEFYELTFEKWKERRSVQANTYFHLLCGKIGEKTCRSIELVKAEMIEKYGAPITAIDGAPAWIAVPGTIDIKSVYPYTKFGGESDKGFKRYFLLKHTADLTTEEMNKLISGTVDEAAKVGVPTLKPQELTALMERWKRKENKIHD